MAQVPSLNAAVPAWKLEGDRQFVAELPPPVNVATPRRRGTFPLIQDVENLSGAPACVNLPELRVHCERGIGCEVILDGWKPHQLAKLVVFFDDRLLPRRLLL